MKRVIYILLLSVLVNGATMNAVNVINDEQKKGPFSSDKRIIGAFGGIPGGLTDITPNELPEIHTKMTEVFTLLGSQREDFKYRIKRVISGKKQVVSGYRYYVEVEAYDEANELKNCKADIWEKTWEHFLQAEMCCDNKKYTAIRKNDDQL